MERLPYRSARKRRKRRCGEELARAHQVEHNLAPLTVRSKEPKASGEKHIYA